MKPIRNNVLWKPFPSDDTSEGGIIIPLNARRISNKGTIVSTGNGTKDRPMKFKQGDIAYRVYEWGQEIEIDGELHFLMDDKSIIAAE